MGETEVRGMISADWLRERGRALPDLNPGGVPTFRVEMRPEWIDENGHMNTGAYYLAMQPATISALTLWGVSFEERARHNRTCFVVEQKGVFSRELLEGDAMHVQVRIAGMDDKRFLQLCQIFHAETGYLAFSLETLVIFIDRERRRAVNFDEPFLSRLAAVVAAHARIPCAYEFGQAVRLGGRGTTAG